MAMDKQGRTIREMNIMNSNNQYINMLACLLLGAALSVGCQSGQGMPPSPAESKVPGTATKATEEVKTAQPEAPAAKNLDYKVLDKPSRDLQDAAYKGDLKRAEGLMAKGAEVNGRSPRGETPLSMAAFRGHLDLVKALLKNGANVNDIDKQGQSPLMKAAAAEREAVVAELLKAGPKVNLQDRTGATALMFSALGRNKEVVRMLLKSGAQVNLRNHEGKTALGLAEGFDNQEVAAMISAAGGTR